MATWRDSRYRHRKKLSWRHVALAIALTIPIVAVGLILLVAQHRTHPRAANPVVHRATAAPVPTSATTHMLFVGDVFWGRTIQTKAERSGLGYNYIVKGLKPADRQPYDAWLANFECPITTHDIPLSLQISALKFNCRPEYLPTLSKWFTAVTLANNHTANNDGLSGLTETRQHLQQNGIQYFGSYDMNQTDDTCEVVSMPAHTITGNSKVHIPVAMCGYMYVTDATPTDAQLAVMRAYAKVMPVIAMPHMGVEYRPTAEPAKISAYQRMIDAGADMVIGAHPHVIQNSESYKGRLIAFSEGNFLFDQQSLGRATTLGLGVGVQLTIADSKAAAIYEQIGPSCAAYKDSCLQQLESKLASRPRFQVAYNFTCFDESGGVAVTGSAAVCKLASQMATLDRLTSLSKQW